VASISQWVLKTLGLEQSKVHRNLDGTIKVMGLEAPDLILVLLVAAVMNLFFGQTRLVLITVFGIPLLLLFTLYFGKKGKPENYLVHLARYLVMPSFYSAGSESVKRERMKQKFYG